MSRGQETFEYLRDSLIEWKYKDTMNNVSGEGFNEDNVVNILGNLPTQTVFDYVYIHPPVSSRTALTTGSRNTKRITETSTIDVYCRRIGNANEGKRKTLEAMYEIVDKISEVFEAQGFLITESFTDLNYNNNNTIRKVMNITKTYIEN